MGLKSFNPYTASRRFITVVDKSHITKQEPEKALLEPKKRSGGRNNQGEIVIWHRGGGHKKAYRKVDFRREKVGVPAKVAAIEYDPNRSANLALLHYADGEKRYILHPVGLEVGATVSTGEGSDILPGNALQFKHIPPGTMVHNLELYPGRGGQVVRSAGGSAQLLSKEGDLALVKLPCLPAKCASFPWSAWRRLARSATSTMRMKLSERPGARGGAVSSRPFAAWP